MGGSRPITVFPFPYQTYNDITDRIKGILDVEMNAGQMLEDVKLGANGKVPIEFHGRMGGIVPTPEEILEALEGEILRSRGIIQTRAQRQFACRYVLGTDINFAPNTVSFDQRPNRNIGDIGHIAQGSCIRRVISRL